MNFQTIQQEHQDGQVNPEPAPGSGVHTPDQGSLQVVDHRKYRIVQKYERRNLMLSWKDYYTQEEIRQDRIREAKEQHLVSMLSRYVRSERKKARDQMLERVGYRLVQWGNALLQKLADRTLAN